MLKLFKKIYFKYIKQNKNITVYLRGKLSSNKKEIYKKYRDKFIINLNQYKNLFKNNTVEIFLEIGFGNGHHICAIANQNKNKIIIGSELYKDGIINTIEKTEKNITINNLKIIEKDGRDIIDKTANNSLEKIYILFPDPWQKARHRKRRILQKDFIYKCIEKLKENGLLILATDWQDYADMIQTNIKSMKNQYKNQALSENNLLYKNLFDDNPDYKNLFYDNSFYELNNSIYKIRENNSEKNIYIHHNTKNYNIIFNDYDIENIISSTFARRAIKENREINIFILEKQYH